jgi:hypothetical protein
VVFATDQNIGGFRRDDVFVLPAIEIVEITVTGVFRGDWIQVDPPAKQFTAFSIDGVKL